MTRMPVPDIEFETPPCPICREDIDVDADGLSCDDCEAEWSHDGTRGTWRDPDADQCPAQRKWNHPAMTADRCVLADQHDGDHGGEWSWADHNHGAITDRNGNPTTKEI